MRQHLKYYWLTRMVTKKDFYVVGIGASAGGLEAVQQLFDNLPADPGVAFVIIQHLSPDFRSLMPELLSKHTRMKIFTADDGLEIEPNCIYLNQRNKNLGLKGNKLVLLDKAPKDHLNLPIDVFFHSLGESFREKSIGVILSGTGSDGSRGIKTIKEAGGTILVQEPGSAQFNGMPNAAILTNLVDFILPPQNISKKLVQFTNNRFILEDTGVEKSTHEKLFQAILEEVHRNSGVNFQKYKYNTLLRRIEKRMSLHNVETLEDYHALVAASSKERDALNQEFLIGVTCFFRDAEAFSTFRKNVIPVLFESKEPNHKLRVWIPGCSTGEEVYSIAMLLEDYIQNNKTSVDYKIFATDVDKKALSLASQGNYPVNNYAEIDAEYFRQYFIKTGDQIQIIKKIREKIIFSHHDVTQNPPFINMDLISCRNMLIYLKQTTQLSILRNFQYALNMNGFLFLGSSESLGTVATGFKTIDAKWKIFQNKKETTRNLVNNISGVPSLYKQIEILKHNYIPQETKMTGQNFNEMFYYKLLTRKHAPVSVFIDKKYNVQFISGDFKTWFNQRDGLFSNNLMNMVSSELATVIKNGIRRLNEKNAPVVIKNFTTRSDDEITSTDLTFENISGLHSDENMYLIQFIKGKQEDYPEQVVLSSGDISNISKQRIEDLEYELKETKAKLQIAVEELEASNEELQSSNEELMSSNEELQSSNEELQSVNEELHTVNSEFQEKNRELENLNNDIINLLNSTDIGTLFLDTNLNIRKFTPAIKRIFNLEDSDIGRSISSFASEFDDETRKSIITHSKTSLEKLQTLEKEIQDNQGNWYLKRISPFVTAEKKIEGVVVTFVDIGSLKKARHQLNESELRLSAALEAGNMAWWELELPSGKIVFSQNKTKMLGYHRSDFNHIDDFMRIVHPEDYENTMNALNDHISDKNDRYDFIYRMQNIKGNYQWFHDVGKIVFRSLDKTIVAGISMEITSKKQIELQLLQAKQKAETANIYKNQFLANISHEIRTPMNGLVGFASLLRKEGLSNHLRNTYVDIVESSSKQLLNLIDDIINVSKIESGELKIEKRCCRLSNLLNEVEITFNELKKKKKKDNILIKAEVPDSLMDLHIKTDKNRLQQILNNLIDNAIKFTDEGDIRFGFLLRNGKVEFKVTDTGIGIPKNSQELIFERFQRLAQKDAAKYDGTGLGLTLSKGLIELLGGTISVESEEGKGTVFTFDIPYEPCIVDEEGPEMKTDILRGKTILVAEDDEFNNMYLREMLKELPVEVLWAENGEEAVELFQKHKHVSLVLMDIRMPVLNGIEAAQEILSMNPDSRIIAQTAYAMAKDKKKYAENGFVDYITKPIQKEDLFKMILKWSAE